MFKAFRLTFCISCALILAGCQLLTEFRQEITTNKPSLHQYYLWLKQLPQQQLVLETQSIKKAVENDELNAELKLLMIYSLPSSPIHNPYNAKAILNKKSKTIDEQEQDKVLLVILRDQLNEQLLILQQLAIEEEQLKTAERRIIKQQQAIIELEQTVATLASQIEQLKAIEHSINNRGTSIK